MEDKKVKVSNSEWYIMECLWEEAPRTIMQIVNELKPKTGWAKSTSSTMISRMEEKGLIYFKQAGKAKQFYPAVSRDEVVLQETESFLQRVYHGSVGMMVHSLIEKNNLSDSEISELYQIIKKAEDEKRKENK